MTKPERTGYRGPLTGTAVPDMAGPRGTAQARALAARLAKVESRNVTFLGPIPPFWTDARGANVRDADGNVFLDFTGAFGVAFSGHGHPRITERIQEQLSRLVHGMGDVHPPAVKVALLEALAAVAPWPDARGVLGSSGSDAVGVALKTAHLATGKHGVLAFQGSYHGLALGALSVTDRNHFREPFTDRLTDHVSFLPFPTSPEELEPALSATTAGLTRGGGTVGAVIIEPIQGRAGVRLPAPDFLPRLADVVRSHGALLIFDEIFTGLGRTGRLYAMDWEGVTPDVLCLGKALGGGLPISACMAPTSVMDAWPASTGEAIHTSTFLGHPLACAAALGYLDVLEEEQLSDRAHQLGDYALTYLRDQLTTDNTQDVRGRGLMLGIELPGAGAAARVSSRALEAGLIVLPAGEDGRVIELTPAAVLTDAQLEAGLQILVKAVRSAS